MGLFSLHAAQVIIVNIELLLAVWLWSRVLPTLSWIVAILLFIAFACISGYQAWIGKASCGCFGKLSVHPWIALALDVLVLTLLAFAKPTRAEFHEDWQVCRANFARRALAAAIFTSVTLASLFNIGLWRFGSIESAIAEMRGEPVSVDPFLSDIGQCRQLEEKEFTIRIVNHLERPIRIVGRQPDCSRQLLTPLPIQVSARDSVELKFVEIVGGTPGIYSSDAVLFLDVGHLEKLRFRVTAQLRGTVQ
jgi:hypothetical protein